MGVGAYKQSALSDCHARGGRRSADGQREFRRGACEAVDGYWRRLFAWADDGKTITWAVGASLFREPVSAISFEPPKEEKKEGEEGRR